MPASGRGSDHARSKLPPPLSCPGRGASRFRDRLLAPATADEKVRWLLNKRPSRLPVFIREFLVPGFEDEEGPDPEGDPVFPADEQGNVVLHAKHAGISTNNSLILSTDPDKLIVTIGMKNLIVIQTEDAVLICPRGESQRVKELVNYLKAQQYTLYL